MTFTPARDSPLRPPVAETTSKGREARWARYARGAGLATILVAVLDIIGTRLGVAGPTAVWSDAPSMSTTTALMTVASGLAVILLAGKATKPARAVAWLCAAGVTLLAALTLGEYAFGPGLDLERLVRGEARFSGRPAPHTAAAFLLLGAALLVFDRRTKRNGRPAEALALVGGAIPFVALLGQAVGLPWLYGVPRLLPHTGMAIQSAVCLLMLSAGIMLARPAAGLMATVAHPGAAGSAARRLLLGVALFPLVALVLVLGTRAGFYAAPIAAVLLVLFTFTGGGLLVLLTARRLNASEVRLVDAHERERRLRLELGEVLCAGVGVADSLAALPIVGLRHVFETIAEEARRITDAEYAALGIGTDPNEPFDPWVFVGMSEEQARAMGPPPRPVGVLAIPAREGRVVRVRDIHERPEFGGVPAQHASMTSFMGVPIKYRGRAVGNIFLSNKRGGAEFTEGDERIVTMLVAQIGGAIEAANVYERETLERMWLDAIFGQMPDAVVIADEQGHVIQQNAAARALTRGEEGSASMLQELRQPSGAPLAAADSPLRRALSRREDVTGVELAIAAPDGQLVPVLASATPVTTARGAAGVVAVFRDLRAVKELERLREEWASVIAHDLRQPLNTISLAAQTILASSGAAPPEAQHKMVEHIHAASKRMSRMIEDLTDVSRIEARRLSIVRRFVDLRALAAQTVEEMNAALGEVRVRLSGATRQQAWVDAVRFQQVLGNLVGNAVKYGTPATPIEVAISGRDDHVEVTVTNHGPGIPPNELPALFTRFARARQARDAATPGLGLGLYIAKGLVEAHGGRIWVESTPGETTRFGFTLPRGAREAAADERPQPSAP